MLATWRATCAELLVDEVQDVDRSQLELALLLAAPANRIFLVGDDDQSIYGWRLADVRRVLDLAGRLPGLRRHDLVTNFRCPAPVVERAVRLVERNVERFAKQILARPGRRRAGSSLPRMPPTTTSGRGMSWPPGRRPVDAGDGPSTHAILARTNRELFPAAAVALELGIPFRAERLALPLEDPRLDEILAAIETGPLAASRCSSGWRALRARLAGLATAEPTGDPEPLSFDELVAAVLAWAAPYRDAAAFVDAVRDRGASTRRASGATTRS